MSGNDWALYRPTVLKEPVREGRRRQESAAAIPSALRAAAMAGAASLCGSSAKMARGPAAAPPP